MKEVIHTPFVSRPRDEDRRTRRPLGWWDRSKILVTLAGLFMLSVWSATGNNPLLPVSEAVNSVLRDRWWIVALAAIEVLRQVHFLVTEHWSAYYLFWKRRFAGVNHAEQAINPWTRYRLARACKWMFWIAVFNGFVVWRNDKPFFRQLVDLPADTIDFLFGPIGNLPLIFTILLQMIMGIGTIVLLFWFLSRGGVDVYFPDDVRTRFTDVWGQDAVLEKVKENIVFLQDPESIESKGGFVPGGILLYGPPGTGKTLIAEAVAGETGHPFVFVEPSAFVAMFMGVGPMKVKGLFRKLRKLALQYGGVVVFFDEADTLGNRGAAVAGGGAMVSHPATCHGASYLSPATAATLAHLGHPAPAEEPARSGIRRFMPMPMGGGGDRSMGGLQALLAEMSGINKPPRFFNRTVRRTLGMRPKPPPKYRILVMMATNMPDSLDPAFLRPGRIDRIYRVGYPSMHGRVRTYEGYLKRIHHELTAEEVERLALMTPYATGATIKDLVNESLIQAIRDGRDVVTWSDVLEARHLKRLGPSQAMELVPFERHSVAVHEACHAVIAYRAQKNLSIDIATIDPGNGYLGLVGSIRVEDRHTEHKSEIEADVMVSLASLAGERLFFDGDTASGVSGDLQQATHMGILMEGYYAMGSTIASHGISQALGVGGGGGAGRGGGPEELLKGHIGQRVEENLARLLRRVASLLEKDREIVLCLAHALEQHTTVAGEDVIAVIERRPGVSVDGSIYRDPAFVRAISEYHEAVFRAHQRAEIGIDVPLPVPNGHQPAYVGLGSDASPWAPPFPAGNGDS